MNKECKFSKLFEEAKAKKRGVEVIYSDENGIYFHAQTNTRAYLHQVDILIWKNNKLTYSFSSVKDKETKPFIIIKNSKKIAITDKNKNFFVFDNKVHSDDDFTEIALVILTFDDEINILIASNKVEEIDRFVTVTDISGEALESLISTISSNNSINPTLKEGENHEGINFKLPVIE